MTGQIPTQISNIAILEKKCRDVLSYESVLKHLKLTEQAFAKICAFLDFLGDSETSLLCIAHEDQRKRFEFYFLAYGTLQTVYSRQTALRDVLKIFGIEIPAALQKSELTIARDRIIGHPITSDGGSHVINRNTLNANGFEYSSYYQNTITRGNAVRYEPLLQEHLSGMEEGLTKLFSYLAKIENEWRTTMQKEPLSPILQGIDYCMNCVAAALVEEKYSDTFEENAALIEKALISFRAGLARRHGDEWASFKVDHVIEGIKILQELYPPSDDRGRLRYEIVADGIECNMAEIFRLANEIDEKENSLVT